MRIRSAGLWLACGFALSVTSAPARATGFFFSTGNPDGLMGMASRPASANKTEIEAADDFVVTQPTQINQVTFTGLVPEGAVIESVRLEIYRVFPNDSDVGRTSGPPTFSTSQVPTRVNSPSDVAFQEREGGDLSFLSALLSPSFTVNNSVVNGINPKPGQTTGGEGAATGQERFFTVALNNPLLLPADHYFFVPQVELSDGDFLWLSAPKPIVPPGTPFPAGSTDLQAWIRSDSLAPDWLRVGTDIVGGNPAPTFNGAFSLEGTIVPEPSTLLLLVAGLGGIALRRRSA
jgi:hypothetical protein